MGGARYQVNMTIFIRASAIQERLALLILVMPILVYLGTWCWEPYAYGYSVLVLAPLQLVWGVIGLVFMAMRLSRKQRTISILVSMALGGSAVAAFLFLKSINWA